MSLTGAGLVDNLRLWRASAPYAGYRFDSKEAMEAASNDVLIGGLKDASQAIAAKVAEQLAK